MAQIRWYLNNTLLDGWQLVDQSAATAATMNAGWVVGTGATFSSELQSNTERASTTFVANTVPDGTLDTTLKDAFRSQFAWTGDFAAGNWTFQFAVVGTVQSGAADGQIVFRILKANFDGSSATEITSAQQSASVVTNVTTTDLNSSATISLPAWSITNQYIFVQVAWKRTGAGGMTTTNVRLRTGSSSTVGTTGLTADFTPTILVPFLASTRVLYAPTVDLADKTVVGGHRASTLVLRVPRVGDLPAHPEPAFLRAGHAIANAAGAGDKAEVIMDTTGGDFIVAQTSYYPGGALLPFSDSEANVWNPLSLETAGNTGARFYWCANPTTSATHHFVADSDSVFLAYPTLQVLVFEGMGDYICATEALGAGSNAGATPRQAGSATPTADYAVLIAGICISSTGGTPSINEGFTIAAGDDFTASVSEGGYSAYLIQATAAAQNPTWSFSSSPGQWSANMAVFQPRVPIATTSMVDWWDLAEASGNPVGAHAGIVLTEHGTIAATTLPLGGRPARLLERANAEYFSAADSAPLSVGAGISFTLAIRVAALTGSWTSAVLIAKDDAGSNREFVLYYTDTWGFRWGAWDPGGTLRQVDAITEPPIAFGADQIRTVIAGYDYAAGLLFIQVDNHPTIYTLACSDTRDQGAEFTVGAGIGTSGANAWPGSMSSVVFDKRVWTADERTTFHNGGAGLSYAQATAPLLVGDSIRPPVIASTTVLFPPSVDYTGEAPVTTGFKAAGTVCFAPRVKREGDITDGLVAHWPMNQSGATALAYDVVSNVALTVVGSAQAGQNAIDSTPARDFETTGSPPTSMSAPIGPLGLTSSPWTFIARVKFESTGEVYLFDTGLEGTNFSDTRILWLNGVGFRAMVNELGTERIVTTTGITSITLGATYVVAGGWDSVNLKVWIRINNGTRFELACSACYAPDDSIYLGCLVQPGAGSRALQLDGAMGPVSLFKANLTNAEIDTWITAKGDYETIGGIYPTFTPPTIAATQVFAPSVTGGGAGADQGVTTQPIASTVQLFAPTVTPPAQAVTGVFIGSTAVLSAPTVTPPTATITTQPIAATAQLFAPTITVGPVSVTTLIRATTQQLFAPTVAPGPVAGTGGTVASTLQLFPPTVAAGPVAVTTGTRASTTTLFSPTVGQSLTTSAILSTAALFAMTVVAGAVTIAAATIPATTTLLTPMVGHAGGAGSLPTLNLTLHLDAADTDRLWKEVGMSTHPANGEAVAAWDDEGDATNFAVLATGTATPLYVSAGFNGQGCLDFDGSNDVMKGRTDSDSANVTLADVITNSAATIFLAFIMEGDAASNPTFYNNDSLFMDGGGIFGLMLSTIAGVNKLSAFNWDGSADFATVDIAQNTKYVACLKHVGGNLSIDVNNGALTATVASGNSTNLTGQIQVGGGYFGPAVDAKIGEVAIYNADVAGSDLADAWTYFMSKWVGGAPQFIDGATRTSTAVLYGPAVAPGPVTITTGTIASSVQAFAPTVAAGPVTVLGATRLSLLQVFAPTVAAGPVAVTTGTRASTLVLSPPTVAPGPVTITGATIASTGQRFAPSVTVGAVTVTTPAWVVSTQLYAPTVTALAAGDLGLTHIPSTLQLYPPTVTTGPVAVIGGTRTSTVQLFAPAVANAQFVGGVTIPTTRVLYPPSVAVGPATVLAAPRASTLTLFAPTVAPGPVTVTTAFRASLAEVFAPLVSIGAVAINAAHRPSTLVLSPPTVVATALILVPHRATTRVLYPPSVDAPTLQTIYLDLRRSTALLYPPRVWAPIVPTKDCAVAFPIAAPAPPGVTPPPARRQQASPVAVSTRSVTPQLVPGASVNRYYVTAKAPAMILHDGFKGTWASEGVYGGRDQPLLWHWELSASKTNAGTTDRNWIIFTNQSGVHTPAFSLWTPPLVAQTISGTFDWCWHLSAIWRIPTGATYSDDCNAWVKVHAYISVGDTTQVRHVLINNHIESVRMRATFGSPTQATSAAAPIALTTGAAQDGDRIRIELGFYAEMPTPEPTQVPTYYSEIIWMIPGATGIDLTPGMPEGFFEQRSPWLQFSNALVEAAPSAPPPNDAAADAVAITTLPFHSAPVDSSHSTDVNRAVWWTWVAPEVGEVLFHTFGSNYYNSVDVLEEDPDNPGWMGAFFADNVIYSTGFARHRSLSTAILNVTVVGRRYWLRVRNRTNGFNVVDGGGMARLGAVRRATAPQQDDLYLPVGNILQVRDGQIVNVQPEFNGYAPSGVAIDYTHAPMADLNGGTHSGERLLVALFRIGLVETIDLPTLSHAQDFPSEIDYLDLPDKTDTEYGAGPSTLHVTAAGQLHIATFGTGFEFVMSAGQPGSKPSYMSDVSEDPANGETLECSATSGENQTGTPVFTRHRPPAVITAPWAIDIDEATNTLYYVEGSFYIPVGGQTVKRFNLTTNTPLADLITLGVPSGARSPGVKGLTFIPYDGSVLVCNATQVVHVDASGSVVGTYTPSVPQDAQTLCDVKMQADGQTFWTVDLDTGRLFKVDLATMTELGTYETWHTPGSLTQMAIYQPNGITPPAPLEPACVLTFPVDSDS